MLALILNATALLSTPRQDLAQFLGQKTDTQAEIEVGRSAYEAILADGRLSKNEAYVRRVQRVLDQLQVAFKDRPYPFQAVVVADNEVNAGCLPGGYMLVHEGLLVKMPRDEQLAFVLGHEMGHAVRRHWVSQYRRRQTDTFIDILGVLVTNGRYQGMDRTLSYLSFSRNQELESDAFGTELYLRAGFPSEAVADGMRVLQALEEAAGVRSPPEYLRSHPNPKRRVSEIESVAKRLLDGGLQVSNPAEPVDVSVRSVFGDLPAIAAAGNPYQPLKTGLSWVYSVTRGARYTVRVVGCADVLTSRVARLETVVGERTVPFQMMADNIRVYRRDRLDQPESPWKVTLMTPETGGAEVHLETLYKHVTIESVATPSGVYTDCLKLEIRDKQGRTIHAWFAPQVGMVKRHNISADIIEVLESFKSN